MLWKNKEALATLLKYKIIIPFDDSLNLYVNKNDDMDGWVVNPFEEAKNTEIGVLPLIVAFGDKSKITNNSYKIVSTQELSYIYDSTVDFSLFTQEQLNEIKAALVQVATPSSQTFSEYAPTRFEYRDDYSDIEKALTKEMNFNDYVTFKKLQYYKLKLSSIFNRTIDEDLLIEIVGNINAKILFEQNPLAAIEELFSSSSSNEYPINKHYLEAIFYNCGITGVKKGFSNGDQSYIFFDLHSINTLEERERVNKQLNTEFGAIEDVLRDINQDSMIIELQDLSPSEVVDYAKKLGMKQYMDVSSHVWEGFSVGEHTETVLRIFESNFANQVPKSLHPLIKYILLIHDIGKGYHHSYTSQKEANEVIGQQLLENMGIDKKKQDMILFIMSHSQTHTSNYFIKKQLSAIGDLENSCRQILEDYTGIKASDDAVKGLMNIAVILQTCDSAAYTRCAITRDENRKVYHYNGNDRFTLSINHCGFGVPRVELKKPGASPNIGGRKI